MPRIRVQTKEIPRCQKPKCRRRNLHRHHIRHQHLFVKAFFETHPSKREGAEKYDQFRRRYQEFRSRDIAYLCAHHHAEVHYLYDKVIKKHLALRLKHLSDFTWEEAEELMNDFETEYRKWIKKKTRGRSPKKRWKDWYGRRGG